jgi:glycogen operon protein
MSEPDRLLTPPQHQTHPLGAHWDGRGTHFAVFAEDAERVDVCLFDDAGRHERRLPMPECSDGVWRGYLPGGRPGQLYGYRAYGPYDPKRGLRFNAHKLLLDPYARALRGELHWHDALYGYRIGSPKADLSFDRRDSAAYLPKAVVVDDRYDWGDDRPPRVPWSDTVIYEVHLKGFTKRCEKIGERERGTFGALGHRHTIEYLKRLGVTAVELLPIHAFVRDRLLVEKNLTNYWGYNTLAFFAPDPAYLSDGTLAQVKWAVQQLHAAGIEVILDVVYNHTCEGDQQGPTLSFRGFANPQYYRVQPDNPRYHINDTGCGNTVNFSHPRVIQLTLDSLRYWVSEFHVDGFRFDLGVTLGRETTGFDPGSGFFDALLQDPLLQRVKLISEPWDIGPGGYQLGNHPPGMAEWNGRYRDEVRKFWRGDAGLRGALAARLQGSADMFDHHRRRPWASVNFITAHDGYTLADWTSYEQKHNEANGEDNRDGANDNESRNWGVEGPTDDAKVRETRAQVQRAMLTTLFTSHGTPMLLGGDEFGRTQQGNNNAYCQDNEVSWYDWVAAESQGGRELREFVARLIALRRNCPSLRSEYFQHSHFEWLPDIRDIDWFNERGDPMDQDDWQYFEGRLLGVRRALPVNGDRDIEVSLLLINNTEEARPFELPEPQLAWRCKLDSAQPLAEERDVEDATVETAAHSVQVLVAIVARNGQ